MAVLEQSEPSGRIDGFVPTVRRALGDAATLGHHVVLVLMDLDALTEVNRNFGWNSGSELLARIDARLAPIADEAARLGGDEFFALAASPQRRSLGVFPRSLLDVISATTVTAHAIRDRGAGAFVPIPPRPVRTTASAGAADWGPRFGAHVSAARTLIEQAGRALREAKRVGEGVVWWSRTWDSRDFDSVTDRSSGGHRALGSRDSRA